MKDHDRAPPEAAAAQDGLPPGLSSGAALAVLLELMSASESDQVRVAAAKIVLARAAEEEERMRKREPEDNSERQAAIHAIARLLDELAAAKSAGDAGAPAMAEDGAPAADRAGS